MTLGLLLSGGLAFWSASMDGQTNRIVAPVPLPHGDGWGGIGVALGRTQDGPIVQRVLENSPASENGIKEGDLITAVDSIPTKELGTPDLVKKMRGPVGSPVALTLVRKGTAQPLQVRLVRRMIGVPFGAGTTNAHWGLRGGRNFPGLTNDVVYSFSLRVGSEARGKTHTYLLNSDHWNSLPPFDPRTGHAPLSIETAIQKAWGTVGLNDPHVSLQSVQLQKAVKYLSMEDSTASLSIWYYLVSFWTDDGRLELPKVMVLMDGTVVQPVITEEAPIQP